MQTSTYGSSLASRTWLDKTATRNRNTTKTRPTCSTPRQRSGSEWNTGGSICVLHRDNSFCKPVLRSSSHGFENASYQMQKSENVCRNCKINLTPFPGLILLDHPVQWSWETAVSRGALRRPPREDPDILGPKLPKVRRVLPHSHSRGQGGRHRRGVLPPQEVTVRKENTGWPIRSVTTQICRCPVRNRDNQIGVDKMCCRPDESPA